MSRTDLLRWSGRTIVAWGSVLVLTLAAALLGTGCGQPQSAAPATQTPPARASSVPNAPTIGPRPSPAGLTAVPGAKLPDSLAQLRLAFVTGESNSDIYTALADGSELTRLTFEPGLFEYDPDWSPDGLRIAYRVELVVEHGPVEGVESDRSYIFVMRADGTEPANLSNAIGVWGAAPSWAPDSRQLVFSGKAPEDQWEGIYVVDVDQALAGDGADAARRITPVAWEAQYPAWAPDGTRIAFAGLQDRDNPKLYTIQPDGAHLTPLTHGPGRDNWPSWAPDSRQIAYHSTLRGGEGVYLTTIDGERPVLIAADVGEPAWSRDGAWLAFDCFLPGGQGIGVCAAQADGSDFVSLLGGIDAGFPAWSP